MSAKETRENLNGAGNLTMFIALVVATIIGGVAIVQQPLMWWQMGLSFCAIAFAWGVLLCAVSQSIRTS